MPTYNNPYFGQAISNIAQLFAPPSGQDMAAGAQVGLLNAKTTAEKQGAQRLADFYAKSIDPNTPREVRDAYGVGAGVYAPNQSYYGVDQSNATSRANNTADNARALAQTQMQEQGSLSRLYAAPITAREGETVYLPNQTAGATGLPGTLRGNINAAPGERVFTPGGQTYEGAPKPLSETEWQAAQNERLRAGGQLTDEDIRRGIMGDIPTEEIVGQDGKPVISYRPDAVGQQPAPKSPLVNIGPNGEEYGNPGEGLAWQRGPDGKVLLDERGVPKAVPFQGGKVYRQEQDAAKQQGARDATVQRAADVVSQDIDRALGAAGTFTTGLVGSQLSGIPGTGAHDLGALIDTIGANVGFDKLQAMREASPTGGALGQVSDKENQLLQATLGSLKQSQSQEQFTYNLKRLKNIYLDIIHGEGQGPAREQLEGQPGAPAQQPGAPASPAAPQAGAVPAFEQMDAAALRSWVEGNSAAIKAMSDADFQRMRARAQQLQGVQ